MDLALERLQSLTVRDVMAREVVWIPARLGMAEVAHLLRRHDLSSAPVVDAQGACVGMLSAADFLRRDEQNVEDASARVRPQWRPEDVAETFMSRAVQSVPLNAPLLQTARIMTAQHVHHLPVIDHHGRPVGMVSTMDVIAAMLNALHEQAIASG
ncbi:MAG: CBS domain-containing protein [Pirellulales bacterium]